MQSEPLRALDLVLPIPDAKLSINGRARIHWAVLKKLKDVVFEGVGDAVLVQCPEAREWHLAAAEIIATFTFGIRRRRDLDNLYGRIKPVIDTIVRVGILVDDDVEHLELRIRCIVQKGAAEQLVVHVQEQPADWQADLL